MQFSVHVGCLDCQKSWKSLQSSVVAIRSTFIAARLAKFEETKFTMTAKTDFTAGDWERLLEAPVIAGMYISMSSPSMLGSIR